jgi:hypothetical protein
VHGLGDPVTELALESGLREDQIIISCKVPRPQEPICLSRSAQTRQPLLSVSPKPVWARRASSVCGLDRDPAERRIGDTIRGFTPRPGGDRREEVYALRDPAGARPAILLAKRDRMPAATHHELDVPAAGRADPGLHPRPDAVEDAA